MIRPLKALERLLPRWLAEWALSENAFLLVIGGVLGVICGLLAVLFEWMAAIARSVFFLTPASLLGTESLIYLFLVIPLMPALGGLLAGALTWFFKMGHESASAAEVMKWAAVDSGVVRGKVIWFRLLTTSIFLGSGGSGGREGPIAQVCGAMGSVFGQALRLSTERLRLLVGCGAAAGIAAAFNAPIAGVIFTVELVLADFNVISFLPIVISSVMATTTKRMLTTGDPVFEGPSYALVSSWEIGLYAILGILCGLAARAFYVAYFRAEDYFKHRVNTHPILKPAIGGLVVGGIGAFFPQVFGGGYEVMNQMLDGNMWWALALALIPLKIIATAVALGSGGAGGVFAPSLFIGCMTGGVFGYGVHFLWPGDTATAGAYAMVGIGAVMAAVAQAPLTNILMGYELTGNYLIILPIMTACIMSSFVMARYTGESLYTEKLRRRGIQLWRGRDLTVMDKIRVREVMARDIATIPESFPFGRIMELIASSRQSYFPVLDPSGKLSGVLSIQNVREIMLHSAELRDLVVAKDIATANVITLDESDNLNQAMEKFSMMDVEQLPVVLPDDPRAIVGMLSRMDVMSAYKKEVLKKAGTAA